MTTFDKVRQWGIDKGITGPNGTGTLEAQLEKTQEELTETRDAAIKLDMLTPLKPYLPPKVYLDWQACMRAELADGIGDCMVTLILAADLVGMRVEDCLEAAYEVIAKRTGKMQGGVFIKDKP
jgi:NTP pyrophosphatase (non-canonical NTP hydrolase)